jgi:hypothetical protein
LRQVVQELQMLPLRTEVLIMSPRQQFDDQGNIKDESFTERANKLLDQLVEYTTMLSPLRAGKELATA